MEPLLAMFVHLAVICRQTWLSTSLSNYPRGACVASNPLPIARSTEYNTECCTVSCYLTYSVLPYIHDTKCGI